MAKQWQDMTRDERILTMMLCFISSFAKIHAMERGEIMPQLDEMARLKTWWNTIAEDQKREILEYIHKLPAELDLFQGLISGDSNNARPTIITPASFGKGN